MKRGKDLYRKKRRELRPTPLGYALLVIAAQTVHAMSEIKKSVKKTRKAINRSKRTFARLEQIAELEDIEDTEPTPEEMAAFEASLDGVFRPSSIKVSGVWK